MSSESNIQFNEDDQRHVIDSIYLVRFKMLYELYEDYFYNKYINDLDKILTILKDELGVTNLFLRRNLDYLMASGYVDHDKDSGIYGITYKGIKFIEEITDGAFHYKYDRMKINQTHIINKFQSGDVLASGGGGHY
jgi:hypothetical protein